MGSVKSRFDCNSISLAWVTPLVLIFWWTVDVDSYQLGNSVHGQSSQVLIIMSRTRCHCQSTMFYKLVLNSHFDSTTIFEWNRDWWQETDIFVLQVYIGLPVDAICHVFHVFQLGDVRKILWYKKMWVALLKLIPNDLWYEIHFLIVSCNYGQLNWVPSYDVQGHLWHLL